MVDISDSLDKYILSHIDPEPDDLHRIYRDTHIRHLYPRMCAGHYQGRLLKMITSMIKPTRVLELGTFTGYSTLSIAEGLPPTAVIDTIEIDDEKDDELRHTFESSQFGSRINLYIGDALQIIPTLGRRWEMVYIDADKRLYSDYLEAVLPHVTLGGFILADNTLWDLKVLDAKNSKDGGQTEALARFNDEVARDKRLEKVILPVRDGLTIMRRIQ